MSSTQDAGGTLLPGDEDDLDQDDRPSMVRNAEEGNSAQDELVNEALDTIPVLDVDDVLPEASSTVSYPADETLDPDAAGDENEKDVSVDGTASIPDDTPSLRESGLSSPRSDQARSIASPMRNSSPSSSPRRPFDRRFHSRLSSSSLLTPRAGSPAFLNAHSRHSSVGSFALPPPSEPDESSTPWEVMRWNKLRKLSGQAFSEVGKRNFGAPTSMAVADSMVIGTSRGMVLVFDHQQNNKAVIGAGTKAVECGPVTALAISADHTTVAAGHATGHIFTWEISRPARPFLHIPPIDVSQPQAKRGDGHVDTSAVIHIGFLAYRRTALVSADDKGMAFSHLATRGMGAIARSVKTTRILGRYPEVISRAATKPLKKSSVLAFAPLPLGNVEQRTDSLGLVAMLTPYLLVIVSTTPVAQTQHKAARPKEVAAHSAMTATLAWFPAIRLKGTESRTSRNKLAYAWSNVLTVLEVHEVEPEEGNDKEKPPELQFLPRNRFKAEEAIVAIQWLSRSVLAVLTITQQLLIIEDGSMNVTDAFDLLPKNVYHSDLYSQQLQAVIESHDEEDTSMHGVVADAFHMSFRAYKGRLFLLGTNEVWWGSLTNWADRLLALMNIGDFIGAIRLATRYYSGQGEKVTIGLPDDKATRESMVGEKLFEMLSASLKYAFGKNQQAGTDQIEKPQMVELAEASIAACLLADDHDFMFDTVFAWYDDHSQGGLFLDVLEPHIQDGTVTSIPPPALKLLVEHFQKTHTPSELENIICLLDTSSMDIDQVTSLCKRYNLYDAYIYVWNNALADFTTPLDELLQLGSANVVVNGDSSRNAAQATNAAKIFPYISFVLTGRTYPTETIMDDSMQINAKSQIYDYFFTAITKRSTGSGRENTSRGGKAVYENLRRVLYFDTPSFMSALNEAFEDSFLNSADDDAINGGGSQVIAFQKTTYNRQFIVMVMLEVMSSGFDAIDTVYLDMFVSRNLPKYPQYMLLSGTALHDIFRRLCHYSEPDLRDDCQLSVEYLLSVYHPSITSTVISMLYDAGFYRVLKAVYRQEELYEDVVKMYFEDDDNQEDVFDVILELLAPNASTSPSQQEAILDLVQAHAVDLIQLNIRRAAKTIDGVARRLHAPFLEALDGDELGQYQYLNALFGLQTEKTSNALGQRDSDLLERYVRLMCQFDPDGVSSYVETLKEGDLRLEEVLPAMTYTGVVDAAVVLEAQSGRVEAAMQRLTNHLSQLGSSLVAILGRGTESDEDMMQQSLEGVVSSVGKYTKVGIWLCQGQTRISQQTKSVAALSRRSSMLQQPLSSDEQLWVELIDAVVMIAREASTATSKTSEEMANDTIFALRGSIQEVFTALLTATTSGRRKTGASTDLAFLRILRTFLSNAAKTAPSLSELRHVIASIFSAYAHEQSLLTLSNKMLDKDVFVRLDDVKQLRQRGWRPRGQVCELCRRKVWGPGLGTAVWEAWQSKEEQRQLKRASRHEFDVQQEDRVAGKGKGVMARNLPLEDSGSSSETTETSLGPVIVFSCRHLYHQTCLAPDGLSEQDQLGSAEQAKLACPACVASRN